MTERFSVAAVVVTYNRLPLLRQCLAALAAQTAQDLTIFLVDNASTDGTAEAVAEMALPNLVYRNTGKNLGGAGGFAYGVREAALAGYDALWLMDDDTLPTPTALEAFLQADRNLQGQYGWLSSRALAPDGTDQPMNLQRVTPYKDLPGFDGERISAVMASFVSLFLRTETVRRYGLPIAEFFIWSDDWEYYRYFYRNDVVLYRREGLRGWLWLLAKDAWHTVQVLCSPQGRKAWRIGIIWKGFFAGVRFRPATPYLP